MAHFDDSVAYLEDSDFTQDGNFMNGPMDMPVVVLIMTSWCGYCKQFKPTFQEFAHKVRGKVMPAVIQADSQSPSEQKLGKRIKEIIPGFRGFPTVALFMNGKFVKTMDNERSMKGLMEFIK